MIVAVFPISQLKNDPSTFDVVWKSLSINVPQVVTADGIRSEFLRYIGDMRDDILAVVEDNYIDKVYRNIFSNYLSTKLNAYEQRCLRISFLEKDFDINDILSKKDFPDLISEFYLGFMTIRPIIPGCVGRSAISPKAFINASSINVMTAPIRTSFLGVKLTIDAFPHSSQDSEYATCAETSIWSVMEYFGNKYPEYSPILPSTIHKYLDNNACQRHVPSNGLMYTDISYVLQSCGFGCKIYSLKTVFSAGYSHDELYRIFSTYVDSGIPMVVAVSMAGSGHAIVCVGEERKDRSLINTCIQSRTKYKNIRYKNWADVKKNFVFNDDNSHSYVCADYDCPTPQYKSRKPYISSIIVPLYRKVYMDAPRAIEQSINFIDTNLFDIKGDIVIRTFLASGRSYLDYLMKDDVLDTSFKLEILNRVSLSKFIWVTEFSSEYNFGHNIVDGILILDATEPMEYNVCYPLLACFEKNMYYFCSKTSKFEKIMLSLHFNLKIIKNYK